MNPRSKLVFTAAAVTLVPPLWLQAQQEPPSNTPTLHVASRLVVLDVVVEDKQGHPVRTLGKDDFTVFDDDAIQNVRYFASPSSHATTNATTETSAESLAGIPLTILLYDELNTRFEDAATVRLALENYLRQQPKVMMQPTMLVALNDAGYQMLANYTRDPQVLAAALKAHKPSLPSRLLRSDPESRLADTFSALRQLALATRGVGDRKNIVWVGNGFPSINVEFLEPGPKKVLADAAHSMTDLLLDSRISVSKIDPRANDSAAPVYSADTMGDTYVEGFDPYEASFSFNTFVQQTGGKYVYGRNDLETQVSQIVTNDSAYYTLTYSPSTSSDGETYHQIAVRLRDPNLVVTTRQGYYAEAVDPAASPDQIALNDLSSAASGAMHYDALGLKLVEFARDAAGMEATCTVALDGSALRWHTDPQGGSTAEMLVGFASFTSSGKMLSYNTHRLDLHVDPAKMGAKALAHPAFRMDTSLPAKATRLRIVALQQGSGRLGSVELSPVPAK